MSILTEAALSCALITTNVGTTPVNIHGSFQTSVAVNFVDGVYAVGLQGYKYQFQENITIEEEQMVQMIGGIDRVYTDIEDSVSLLDRVIIICLIFRTVIKANATLCSCCFMF